MAHAYWNARASRYYMKYLGVAASGGRKWRTKAAPQTWTKKQAERGEAATADAELLSLGGLCTWWLEHWRKPASVKRESSRLSVHVQSRPLGALPLKKVTAEAIEGRLREMEQGGAASATVEHVRRTLRRAFNCACKSKIWNANPASDATPRSMDSKRPPPTLMPEEARAPSHSRSGSRRT